MLNPPCCLPRRTLGCEIAPIEQVLPHVAQPLRYCDLLSDGYERGGIDALHALKGLFVLMHKHNLEFPRFYSRLYQLVSAEAFEGPHAGAFASELQLLLSSTGLPAYLLAAFAKASPSSRSRSLSVCG